MKVASCPRCESEALSDQWHGPGRCLRQCCKVCGWWGPLRIPEQQEVKSVKRVQGHSGYNYEVFDCYGHALIYSHTYKTKKEAERDLLERMEYGRTKDKEAGPYTGVLWVPTVVEVHGTVYK